jgi:Tol biopolymer transport system component/DNA-binding winged helix-turn-helix (wHTH) protein
MSEEQCRFYDFADFRLDTRQRLLLKDGEPVQLTYRAYQVLQVLVENGGQVMSKDDLMDTVWGDTIVEEGNLKNLVYSLRKVLGESEFIQTLPKRGYKFVAEVKAVPAEGLVIERYSKIDIAVEEEIETEDSTAVPLALPAAGRTRALPWLVAAPVLLAVLAAGSYFFNIGPLSSRRVFALENAKVTSLTFGTNALYPIISPDGKFVAYISNDNKTKAISVRQLGASNSLKLLNFNGAVWGMSFSRDSNSLYAIVANDEFPQGALYLIPALGGSAKKLLENIGSLAVSPVDETVAYIQGTDKVMAFTPGIDAPRELFDIDEKLKGKVQHISWAPDAKSFFISVVRFENNTPYWQIGEFSLDGNLKKDIGPRSAKPVTLLPTPDGAGLVTLEQDGDAHVSKISYLSRYGSEPPRSLNLDTNYYNILTLTADGKTLLAGREARPTSLSVAPANAMDQATQIASGYLGRPRWAGSGKLIIDSIENGHMDIFSFDVSAETPGSRQQLTGNSKRNSLPVASPDGRYIYYVSNFSGRGQLWRMNLDGADNRRLTDQEFSVDAPVVSPDGETVYFAGFSGSQAHVYRTGKDGGDVQQVAEETTGLFALSPDGKKVAFAMTAPDGRKEIMRVRDLAGSVKDLNFDLPYKTYWQIKWAPDAREIYYEGDADAVSGCIFSQPLSGGPPVPVKCLKNENFVGFDWSPDGKQIAFTTCHYLLDAVIFNLN